MSNPDLTERETELVNRYPLLITQPRAEWPAFAARLEADAAATESIPQEAEPVHALDSRPGRETYPAFAGEAEEEDLFAGIPATGAVDVEEGFESVELTAADVRVVSDRDYPLILLIDSHGQLTLRHQLEPGSLVIVLEEILQAAKDKVAEQNEVLDRGTR